MRSRCWLPRCAHWVGREVGGVRRAGRAGAAGLWRGGGGEGESAKVACARADSHPPLPQGESLYPPPAWPRRLIGSRGPENWPAFMQVQSIRGLAGAAGRRSQVPALPKSPRRSVWPRAPAQRGRKSVLGVGVLSGGAGASAVPPFELLLHEGRGEADLLRAVLRVEEGTGAQSAGVGTGSTCSSKIRGNCNR